MNSRTKASRRSFLRSSMAGAAGLLAAKLNGISVFATMPHFDAPVAATRYGKVRGYVDNGVSVFKGIRYGTDTSPRRFLPPLTPDPWAEVRDALEYGAAAPQTSRGNEKTSEDCLFLNVWTPALRDRGKRPVM